jgi:hypothetical protein
VFKFISIAIGLAASVWIANSAAFAQTSGISVNSRASAGGYTGTEIRSIYRQDIGQGYTGSSLNSIALQSAQARVGNVGQSSAGFGTVSSVPSVSSSSSSKPFSSVSSSPAVSPYMNLFRDDFGDASDLNYQTLVRPQLQQQQYNQQFQRQNMELSSRVQKISAQSAFQNPSGSESMYPTGHPTAFGGYSHFYPSLSQRRR